MEIIMTCDPISAQEAYRLNLANRVVPRDSLMGKDVKVAIGTVKGDHHDIGKNLVAMMLEGTGFKIENMGVDIPPDRFLEAARNGAKVIGLSSLLTTSMDEMRIVIELFERSGLRNNVTFIVGGASL